MNIYFPKKSAFSLCFMLLALTTLVSAGDQQLRGRKLMKSSKSSKSKSSKSPTIPPSQFPSQSPSEEIIPINTPQPTDSPTETPSSSPTKKPKSTKSPKKTKSPKSTSAPTQQETINQAPAFEFAFIVNAKCDAADAGCTKENLEQVNLKAYEDEQCLAGYSPNNKCPGGIAVGLAVEAFETTAPGSGRKLQAVEKSFDVKVTSTSDNEAHAQGSSAQGVDDSAKVRDAVADEIDGYTAAPAPATPSPTPAPSETQAPGRARRLSNHHRVPVKPSRGQAAFASHRLANEDKAARKLMKGGMMNRRLKSVVKPRA